MVSVYNTYILCTILLSAAVATDKWTQMIKCTSEADPNSASQANLTFSDRAQCASACFAHSTCNHASFYPEGTCKLGQGKATCGASSEAAWTFCKVCAIPCDEGWFRHNDSCYLPVADAKIWSDSVAHCASLDAHLVSIRSLEEHTFVVDLLSNYHQDWSKIWIGASDLSVDGVMEWVSGESWDFDNWDPGEPSGTDWYDGKEENCVDIRMDADAKWNDVHCGYTMPFFCEKYSVF